MSTPISGHTPYADPAAPADLYDDCRATTAALSLPTAEDRIMAAALRPAPSLLHADQPLDRTKTVDVDAAASRIARAIFDD